MNPNALAAAVIAMLAWGAAAIFDKLGMRGIASPVLGLMIRLGTATVAVGFYGLLSGQLRELRNVPAANAAYFAIGGLLAALVGQFAYFTAIKHADASRVVPFTASYPVVALLLAALILREPLTVPKVIGTVLILGGLMLVSGVAGK